MDEQIKALGGRLVRGAARFARAAHERINQQRKYGEGPYFQHPLRVAHAIKTAGGAEAVVAAALCHDVVEDTGVTLEQVREATNARVATLVAWCTDRYTAAAYPLLNRAQRHALELVRLENIEVDAVAIKCADFLDNWASIVRHDPDGFAKTVAAEKRPALVLYGRRMQLEGLGAPAGYRVLLREVRRALDDYGRSS